MTVSRSSGAIDSRSKVYFGFWSWNLLTCISIAALSRVVVSGASVRYLMTSPPPWLPPQPAVPRSAAPTSPPPPNLKKSFRLTVLSVFCTLSCFPPLHLRTSPTPRRSLTAHPCRLQHPLHR